MNSSYDNYSDENFFFVGVLWSLCLSVRLCVCPSVCLSVTTITQEGDEISKPNFGWWFGPIKGRSLLKLGKIGWKTRLTELKYHSKNSFFGIFSVTIKGTQIKRISQERSRNYAFNKKNVKLYDEKWPFNSQKTVKKTSVFEFIDIISETNNFLCIQTIYHLRAIVMTSPTRKKSKVYDKNWPFYSQKKLSKKH